MSNYLVTGGCGFIGSHLVHNLVTDGHRVRVLDDLSTGKRDNLPGGVELVVGDAADAALTARCMAGVNGCFHLAAVASVQRSVEDWIGTHRANQTATIAVLDAARPQAGRPALPVVFASSAAVYGANPAMPLDERQDTRPLSAYGADKLACELHGAVAAGVFGVPVTALRFFNVYGPRQDPGSPYSGVISIFAERTLAGRPLTFFGDGSQSRDFVYVGDVVRFLRAAMASAAPGLRVFNVCGGKPITLLELADTLEQVCGRKTTRIHAPARPGDIRVSLGNPAAAAAGLGVVAATPLRTGLAETCAWLA